MRVQRACLPGGAQGPGAWQDSVFMGRHVHRRDGWRPCGELFEAQSRGSLVLGVVGTLQERYVPAELQLPVCLTAGTSPLRPQPSWRSGFPCRLIYVCAARGHAHWAFFLRLESGTDIRQGHRRDFAK